MSVTVAVEVPFKSVDAPTVHRPVVDEEKLTIAVDVVVAETVKVCADDDVTRSERVPNEMLFASPTRTLESMYMTAPTPYPPDASYVPLTNLKR
jgi:hypothetical protein